MIRCLFTLVASLVGFNAFAQPISIKADLAKVDNFQCNIESHGENQLRILTTAQNDNPNRYLDLYLDDKDAVLTVLPSGWQLSKSVDLHKQSLHPWLPSWAYRLEITTLIYEVDTNGSSKLTVSIIPSNVRLPKAKTDFECFGVSNTHIDKRQMCPNCLSSQE